MEVVLLYHFQIGHGDQHINFRCFNDHNKLNCINHPDVAIVKIYNTIVTEYPKALALNTSLAKKSLTANS